MYWSHLHQLWLLDFVPACDFYGDNVTRCNSFIDGHCNILVVWNTSTIDVCLIFVGLQEHLHHRLPLCLRRDSINKITTRTESKTRTTSSVKLRNTRDWALSIEIRLSDTCDFEITLSFIEGNVTLTRTTIVRFERIALLAASLASMRTVIRSSASATIKLTESISIPPPFVVVWIFIASAPLPCPSRIRCVLVTSTLISSHQRQRQQLWR